MASVTTTAIGMTGSARRNCTIPTDLTKGPDTLWDAPGMQRIKIPFGGLNPDQMDVLADLAEEYADGVLHVTTRQDFQYHFVHIDDTPTIMRRLGAVGITTREACGNSIRNVTACPLAGVCNTEAFDVTPYAKATAKFMLGHPDAQDFGRKFKIAFSGCREEACGLVNMHDMGASPSRAVENGKEQRGFEVYVGGGLGAVPHQAKLFDEFVPEEELLPLTQAIVARLCAAGREEAIATGRGSSFWSHKLGIEEFKQARPRRAEDVAARSSLDRLSAGRREHTTEKPLKPPTFLNGQKRPEGFEAWYRNQCLSAEAGGLRRRIRHAAAGRPVVMADARARRYRATLQRRHVRTTVEQNIVLRWVSETDLPDLYRELDAHWPWRTRRRHDRGCYGLPGNRHLQTRHRFLARPGRRNPHAAGRQSRSMLDEAVKNLRIKISGCFNSCGQHHIADLGFYGMSRQRRQSQGSPFPGRARRKMAGQRGRLWSGDRFACRPRRFPDVIDRITERYVRERTGDESFQDFHEADRQSGTARHARGPHEVPPYEVDPSFYSDWGDPREYTIGDMGIGECAGEVISPAQFDLAAAERSSSKLSSTSTTETTTCRSACLQGDASGRAFAGARRDRPEARDDADSTIQEFRTRFFETNIWGDRYAGSKFAQYLFKRHASPPRSTQRPGSSPRRRSSALCRRGLSGP